MVTGPARRSNGTISPSIGADSRRFGGDAMKPLEGCEYWNADWGHSVIPWEKPCDGTECPQCKDLNDWLDRTEARAVRESEEE